MAEEEVDMSEMTVEEQVAFLKDLPDRGQTDNDKSWDRPQPPNDPNWRPSDD